MDGIDRTINPRQITSSQVIVIKVMWAKLI